MPNPRVVRADLRRADHQLAVLELTRAYARDPMGSGRDLPAHTRERLIERLREHPTALVFLAVLDEVPIGIATCFVGFSTFAAAPLINVHDLHVLASFQRRGVARLLLDTVEAEARKMRCCKLTLEVQENNRPARSLYASCGFSEGAYTEQAGSVLFREKKIHGAGRTRDRDEQAV